MRDTEGCQCMTFYTSLCDMAYDIVDFGEWHGRFQLMIFKHFLTQNFLKNDDFLNALVCDSEGCQCVTEFWKRRKFIFAPSFGGKQWYGSRHFILDILTLSILILINEIRKTF